MEQKSTNAIVMAQSGKGMSFYNKLALTTAISGKRMSQRLYKAAPYLLIFTAGFLLTYTKNAYAVTDGTQKIATGLDNLVSKGQLIGPSAAAVGFAAGSIIHGISHDPKVQEMAKVGMKGSVIGGAGVFIAASIVGMAASAFQ